MPLNLANARKCLQDFDFTRLFVEELGWSQPAAIEPVAMACKDLAFTRREVAQLSGVVVFEIESRDGSMPDPKARAAAHKEIFRHHHENILIFVDARRTQSLWYWAKRQEGKTTPRSHIFVKGQSGDLFLSKLGSMVFDLSEFDDFGNVPLLEVTDRIKQSLDIERVTKKFYNEFQDQHLAFIELIEGIGDERDRHWYASVLLNRLMFIYFLQRKFFLDGGDGRYLQSKLEQSRQEGRDRYYEKFLKILFFEGFAKPEGKRGEKINALLGKIKYLNGGLFLHHRIELEWPNIAIPDKAFEDLFALFERYSWNLNDTPGGEDNEINPDVLGYIFEKYINQKAFGAYYTRPEITEYLCERTIHRLILDGVNGCDTGDSPVNHGQDAHATDGHATPAKKRGGGRNAPHATFDNMGDLLLALDAPLCKKLLHEVLPNLRLLDPACGSAAFLVSAMKTLINVYSAVIGKIEFLSDRGLQDWLRKTQKEHKSVSYFIKRSIITNNLFGVDIMEEAIEIAKLRLFLALVASANAVDDLEPLPNIEFNIMAGNSLIGLLHVDPAKFDAMAGVAVEQARMTLRYEPGEDDLGFAVESKVGKTKKEVVQEYAAQMQHRKFRDLLTEKNELIALYRRATGYGEDLQELRDGIEQKKNAAKTMLNQLLLTQFQALEIKYENATWDEKKNREGKPVRRVLNESDIAALKPFHWGYEFDEIINQRGGFDAIITNPPWEVFEPSAKEFFEEYSDVVTKNKMSLGAFEKEQAKLLRNESVRNAWLAYLSRYPYQSRYFKKAPQYVNQLSVIEGKTAASKTNLYKLFVEQSFRLLRSGGQCGMVIPDGIYNGRGSTQLRRLLLDETAVTGLFCIENRHEVFENVHRSFKIVVLTFRKGGPTREFPATFMRTDVTELAHFPAEGAITLTACLIREFSPDMLAITEFKRERDVGVVRKFLAFPRLDERVAETWNVNLAQELNMTSDHGLFRKEAAPGRLPLVQGGVIHQFNASFSDPKSWIDEKEGRKAVLGRVEDQGQKLPYQCYRFAHRRIARSTDERAAIACVLPPGRFCADTAQTTRKVIECSPLVFLTAMFNSFLVDWELRLRITTHVDMHFVYAMRIPRLTSADAAFRPIVERAARLICTTPEFDDLAKEIFGGRQTSATIGATDPVERAKLRAELDGLIAHLYGLTEEEFAYILTTFPLVPDPVKIAAHNAFRNVEKGLIK